MRVLSSRLPASRHTRPQARIKAAYAQRQNLRVSEFSEWCTATARLRTRLGAITVAFFVVLSTLELCILVLLSLAWTDDECLLWVSPAGHSYNAFASSCRNRGNAQARRLDCTSRAGDLPNLPATTNPIVIARSSLDCVTVRLHRCFAYMESSTWRGAGAARPATDR